MDVGWINPYVELVLCFVLCRIGSGPISFNFSRVRLVPFFEPKLTQETRDRQV